MITKNEFMLVVDRLHDQSSVGYLDVNAIAEHDKELARIVEPWIKASNELRKLIELKTKDRQNDDTYVPNDWYNCFVYAPPHSYEQLELMLGLTDEESIEFDAILNTTMIGDADAT